MPNPTVKSRIAYAFLAPLSKVRDIARAMARYLRLMLLRHRARLIASGGRPYSSSPPKQRLLAAVTHVVSPTVLSSEEARCARLAYVSASLQALSRNFAHYETTTIVNTFKDLNLLDSLSSHQRERCRILEHQTGDPMMIEFAVQDLFLRERNRFDWFLFIEDDIAIHDACFIEKIDEFNRSSAAPNALLLPHRFEMNAGDKIYIDRDFENKLWKGPDGSNFVDVVNPITTITYHASMIGRKVRFAEFTNPHAACYCLSPEQISTWGRSGRRWRERVVWIGPLESAATGSLYEVFDLYKPHPDNRWYLEIEHLDPKYSARLKAASARPAKLP